MLHLPKLNIARDEPREVQVFLKLRKWIESGDNERHPGIHASDLLNPKLSYWRKKQPKDTTERQVYFYSIGKILHMLVLSAMRGSTDFTESDTKVGEQLGIQYSIDHIEEGNPVELKTHRGQREPKPGRIQEEFTHYLDQLAIYMVMENKLVGELWVLFINLLNEAGKTFPEVRCYRVEMTEEQFYEVERQVVATREALEDAIEQDDPRGLEHCISWLCSTNCAYWSQCKPPGRWPSTVKKLWTS